MASTPSFPQTPSLSSVVVAAANTSSQGGGTIGTDIFLAKTTTTAGSYIERVRFAPAATAPTNTTATVGRVFWSTVTSGATTSSNTHLLGEISLPVVSADNATTSAPVFDLMLNFPIQSTGAILVTLHGTPAANTHWKVTVIAGDL